MLLCVSCATISKVPLSHPSRHDDDAMPVQPAFRRTVAFPSSFRLDQLAEEKENLAHWYCDRCLAVAQCRTRAVPGVDRGRKTDQLIELVRQSGERQRMEEERTLLSKPNHRNSPRLQECLVTVFRRLTIENSSAKTAAGPLKRSPSAINRKTSGQSSHDITEGPRLYKQPATKSNRGIILNAVEYCVFPGAVNRDAKQKVLEKIARSEAKHFLVLFRDAGCQFRALYGYWPENEQIIKLYGTGPSQVDDVMFDKFFKYNSGAKCFTQVHTKHLTVTIDAFTIHNSLWQGKKANLPSKKDMALVI